MSSVVDVHKKDGKTPHFDIYIGRQVRFVDWTWDSKWGNYFYQHLDLYEAHIRGSFKWNDLELLKGKVLGCWCITTDKIEPLKCHGQILMKLVREKFK
ncbi:hypothetical protein LCGC14_0987760 [marine sediment metagenome]|uniref:DUF4326 domain-containing protein n=1 Tax=marine sediment metagenome TaxID=412755 RepID=A0A0F9NTB2_9ZZZZ